MQVALVAGAGSGIGRANAMALVADGLAVAVNDIRADAARAVADEITRGGGTAQAFPASVTDLDASRTMVERVSEQLGPVDVLVSGVSGASHGRSLAFTPLEEIESLFRVNVLGTVVLCQWVLPSMRERHNGAIVVISSIAAQAMDAKSGPYNIAKASLEATAYTLAKEEARYGIRVNVVAPGDTDTPLGREVRSRVVRAQTGREPTESELSEGMAPPTAVADVVRFLASPSAALVTGQRINVVGVPAQILSPMS